jgi:hypothetical protein
VLQDPYVSACLLPGETESKKTEYVYSGGTSPVWPDDNSSLVLNLSGKEEAVLIQIWHTGTFSDDLIGSAQMKLPLATPNDQEHQEQWLNIDTGGRLKCAFTVWVFLLLENLFNLC